MKFTASVVAILFAATGALAAPGNPPKVPTGPKGGPRPPPPPPQPITVQQNQCGNGAAPYCCDSTGKGDVECSPINVASNNFNCNGFTMCCNAANGASSNCQFNTNAGSVTITKKKKVENFGW